MKEIQLYQPIKRMDIVSVKAREYRRLKKADAGMEDLKASIAIAVYTIAVMVFGFAVGTGIIHLMK